ncbi:UNVERIFIED_CONTAM: hypothetical protein Slati_2470200 [Sesamum latifolium]|uniref:Aminotransferase-like plant mobile domain-containing protein n=1 Tax=Sesamum latifolium TaxID=2727402 RepID=A0AAW2WDF1_9LAMI
MSTWFGLSIWKGCNMIYFKDKSSPSGEHHLIILDDQHQLIEKGTMLAVYTPLVGGRNAFCEAWCPLTNTLLTSVGELSISQWDLHDLAGFPMTGCLYDEVVPSPLELTGADEKGGRFIPRSSKYLLYAYHLLQGADDDRCSNISIDKWVKFWSKKAIKYHLPPPRKEKKTVRPKSTHNPLGDITTHKRWSTADEALLEKLCIEGTLKEEVYLAAYLACWLCMFVLPGKDVNSIRPSTFKMASMTASGRRVSLAIPALASIYEDLNTIAISSRPARTSPSCSLRLCVASILLQDSLSGLARVAWSKNDKIFW